MAQGWVSELVSPDRTEVRNSMQPPCSAATAPADAAARLRKPQPGRDDAMRRLERPGPAISAEAPKNRRLSPALKFQNAVSPIVAHRVRRGHADRVDPAAGSEVDRLRRQPVGRDPRSMASGSRGSSHDPSRLRQRQQRSALAIEISRVGVVLAHQKSRSRDPRRLSNRISNSSNTSMSRSSWRRYRGSRWRGCIVAAPSAAKASSREKIASGRDLIFVERKT